MSYSNPPWTPNLDAEADRFAKRLIDEKYPDGVDDLGWIRWGSDWRQHRANGLSEEQAWNFVARSIDAIRENKPELAPQFNGKFSVPWPPELDREAESFATELRTLYWHEHPAGNTDVDFLGWVRWSSDFRIHRANGLSYNSAVNRIKTEIRRIWGIKPDLSENWNRFESRSLIIKGRQSWDGDKQRIPVFLHFMEALGAWCHGRQEEVKNELTEAARYYAGIRYLDHLGYWDSNRPGEAPWTAWKGRELTPYTFTAYSGRTVEPTRDYWQQYEEFLLFCHSIGLQVICDRGDLNGLTSSQKLEHMRNVGRLFDRLGYVGREVLGALMACNETYINGVNSPEFASQMLDEFKNGAGWWPSARGLGSPNGRPDGVDIELPISFQEWSIGSATLCVIHGNRGSIEHLIEHYFGYGGYDKTIRDINKKVWNLEPIGGGTGVSVYELNDPEMLCGIAAVAMMTGQAWTFMSGNGVFFNGPISSMPGYLEVAALTKWIPADAADFTDIFHAGIRSQTEGKRIFTAVDPTRFDVAIHRDGRFTAVCHTAEAPANELTCERDCTEFTVVDMVTGAIEREGPIFRGQKFRHNGKARLIVGRLG